MNSEKGKLQQARETDALSEELLATTPATEKSLTQHEQIIALQQRLESQQIQLDWYRDFLKADKQQVTFSEHAKRLTHFSARFFSPAVIVVSRLNSAGELIPVHIENHHSEFNLSTINKRFEFLVDYIERVKNKEQINYVSGVHDKNKILSILEEPLLNNNKVVGSIAVLSNVQRTWSSLDIATINDIANTLSHSIVQQKPPQIYNSISINNELFYELPICIIELDLNGLILRVNAEMSNVITLKNEAIVIGNKCEDFFITQYAKEFRKHFKFALNGNVVQTELVSKIKYGNNNLLVNFIPRLNTEDKVCSVFCVFQCFENTMQSELLPGTHAWMQSVLAEFGLNALSATNLDDLLAEAIIISVGTLAMDFAGYLELSEDTKWLTGRVGSGWKNIEFTDIKLASLSFATTDLFNTRKCIVSSNIDNDNRFKLMGFLQEHKIQSGISIGVLANNQIHGLLGVYTTAKKVFQPEEISFIRSVANILAEAITRISVDYALRVSEERFRAVFEQAIDSIVLIDVQTGKILEFNDSTHINLHYSREEFHKLYIFDVDSNKDKLALDLHLRNVKQHGFDNYETRHQTKSGELRDVMVSTREIYLHENTLHLSIWRDVTERKIAETEREELQNQLVQSQKMEALGQLTGGIAHDFNNILASILGYTELAMLRSDDILDEKLQGYLQQVQKSGERARDLISQMLAFGRTSNTKPQAVNIDLIVQEVTKLLHSLLPTTIETNLAFDDSIPMVMMDPVQLHQIVMNLCINARDAMNGVGKLSINVYRVFTEEIICTSCQHKISGEYVELCVEDNGSGIETENISKIFEPFYSTKPVDKGTGMGLSVVHGIVHQVDGHILVDSSLKQGTRFSILFPVTLDIEQNISADIKPAIDNSEGHILVVDDEESLLNFTSELLVIHGFHVTTAGSAIQALTIFKTEPDLFDLIITDQTMPAMTGLELSKQIKQIKQNIPIILCTGYSDQVNNENARQHGVSEYLGKPVKPDVLLSVINRLIANKLVSPP